MATMKLDYKSSRHANESTDLSFVSGLKCKGDNEVVKEECTERKVNFVKSVCKPKSQCWVAFCPFHA